MKFKTVLLICIIALAALLRLWQLGGVPASIDWDEAALGYNGYSILHTGRDEYGAFLPIVLRSFGDYKPALYSFLTIPFIKLFDLNAFTVRLPSALAGILAVLITYYLARELFGKREITPLRPENQDLAGQTWNYAEIIALLSAFLLAISPWHIQFSRAAFEANVGLTLNLAGILFFLKGLKRPWFIAISAFWFGLSIYVYQSEKLFVPIIIVVLAISFLKQIVSLSKKKIAVSLLIFFIVILPMVFYVLTNKNSLARAQGVSFLSQRTALLQPNTIKLQQDIDQHDFIGLLFDNRRIVFGKTIISAYLSHFDLNWLFFKGDKIARLHAPGVALLYVFELPFLLIGLYFFIFSKLFYFSKSVKMFILLWFLTAPLPASVTYDVPNALRTLNFLPTFQFFTAVGIVSVFFFVNKFQIAYIWNKVFKFTIYSCFLLLAAFNLLYYLDQYFVQQNYYNAKDWQYGFQQLVAFLWSKHDQYKKIIVSNRGDFDESYMFFLFYTKYDPRQYLAEGGTQVDGVERAGNKFANFEFRTFNYYQENDVPELMSGSGDDFPQNFIRIKEIDYPDKIPAMYVIEKDRYETR